MDSGYTYFKKIVHQPVIDLLFFSYLILIRATDIMEQINLMITRRQDSNISYIHNTSTCNVFQIPIVSLVDNHNNITFYCDKLLDNCFFGNCIRMIKSYINELDESYFLENQI